MKLCSGSVRETYEALSDPDDKDEIMEEIENGDSGDVTPKKVMPKYPNPLKQKMRKSSNPPN